VIENFYRGLRILIRYDADMCAEHDEIYFHVDMQDIPEIEIKQLEDLGFHIWSEDADTFVWYT